MLEVQRFLKDNHTLEDLEQFGIEFKKHPVHDIYILDYNQINSKPGHPMSDETRSLVLDSNFDIVSGCMKRFFNIGQFPQSDKEFNWNNFVGWEKRDGSMISVTVYKGELLIRTRYSWADLEMGISGKTWEQFVRECLTNKQIDLICNSGADFTDTFVFELETPFNQVVLYHETPQLVLLTIIRNDNGQEWGQRGVGLVAEAMGFKRPIKYEFSCFEEVETTLAQWEKEKRKDEGFVLIDDKGNKKKIKNKYYMHYHVLCTGISSIRQVFDIVWNPNIDVDEICLYFPHLAPKLQEVQDKIDQAWTQLWNVWFMTDEIIERKKFAFTITRADSPYYTRFSSILFRLRDIEGTQPADMYLRAEWLKSKDLIFKVLFKE